MTTHFGSHAKFSNFQNIGILSKKKNSVESVRERERERERERGRKNSKKNGNSSSRQDKHVGGGEEE